MRAWIIIEEVLMDRYCHNKRYLPTQYSGYTEDNEAACGHSAVLLDDGTYISWWPNLKTKADEPIIAGITMRAVFHFVVLRCHQVLQTV